MIRGRSFLAHLSAESLPTESYLHDISTSQRSDAKVYCIYGSFFRVKSGRIYEPSNVECMLLVDVCLRHSKKL